LIKEKCFYQKVKFFSRETYPHTTNPHDSYHFFYWTRIILALFTGDTHTFYILFGRTLDFPYPPEAPPHVLCFVFNNISLPHVKYNPYYKYKNLIFIFLNMCVQYAHGPLLHKIIATMNIFVLRYNFHDFYVYWWSNRNCLPWLISAKDFSCPSVYVLLVDALK